MKGAHAVLMMVPLCVSLCGCLAADRLNDRCEWTHDAAARLDLNRPGDRRHLVDDVEIAEELGIRYGDSFRQTLGLHEEHRRTASCTAALFATIERTHEVTPAAVAGSRGERPILFDLSFVFLPVAVLFAVAAWFLTGLIDCRFPPGEGVARFVVGMAASLVLTAAFYQLGSIWSGIAEDYRLRTTHLSYRGVGLFWLVAIGRRAHGRSNGGADDIGAGPPRRDSLGLSSLSLARKRRSNR